MSSSQQLGVPWHDGSAQEDLVLRSEVSDQSAAIQLQIIPGKQTGNVDHSHGNISCFPALQINGTTWILSPN